MEWRAMGNKARPRNVLISCHFVSVIHPFVLSNSRLRFRTAATLTHRCPLIVLAAEGIHCSSDTSVRPPANIVSRTDWRIRLNPQPVRVGLRSLFPSSSCTGSAAIALSPSFNLDLEDHFKLFPWIFQPIQGSLTRFYQSSEIVMLSRTASINF